ncbi:MAG TPA: hypothetical protein VMT85_23640 [Thermoanaerobaculia bacterium]|nr:hypothetical protein [Thermoanaerobaculia bacterium]
MREHPQDRAGARPPSGGRVVAALFATGLLAIRFLAIGLLFAPSASSAQSLGPASGSQEPGAEAEEDGRSRPSRYPGFTFNGFGTLGLTRSNERGADFVANSLRPQGPGRSDEWSPDVDSRLGLQLSADLMPKLTAVVQVVVEQTHDDDYEPTIEWANLKFSITEDLGVRIGRTALPTFLVADHRKVGFANPWVRPPIELYGLVPVFNSDGLDLSYRHRLGGGWGHTIQAIAGFSNADLPGGSRAEIRDLYGLFDTFERSALTLRTALATGRVTIDFSQPLFDLFRAFGPEGVAIADRFDVDDQRIDFASVGVGYDPGEWFVTAEGGQIRGSSLVADRTSGYVTGGRRMGDLTVHVTYSEAVRNGSIPRSGLTLSTLPPELVPPASALNAALDEVLTSIVEQRTVSLGLRWDFRPDVALKLQLDRIEAGPESYGPFVNRDPGFEAGADATLITLNCDFVF